MMSQYLDNTEILACNARENSKWKILHVYLPHTMYGRQLICNEWDKGV